MAEDHSLAHQHDASGAAFLWTFKPESSAETMLLVLQMVSLLASKITAPARLLSPVICPTLQRYLILIH